MIGFKTGKLTVIELSHKDKQTYWRAKCECGNIRIISTNELNRKRCEIKSCGCYRKKIDLFDDNSRFMKKVEKTDSCWIWKAGKMKSGYGLFWLKTTITAHRASWILHFGEIQHEMCVCHKCDNPCCVNPDHLFLGTHKDNTHDCIEKGRFKIQETKIHKSEFEKIINLYENGMTQREIGKLYDANQAQIWKIVCKKYPSLGHRKGSRNNNCKLKEEEVLQIRSIYIPYIVSMPKIAQKYNVSLDTIDRIIRRETWTHI